MIANSVIMLHEKSVFFKNSYIDFTDSELYFLPAIAFFIFGLLLIFFALLPPDIKKDTKIVKCIECKREFPRKMARDGSCPKCGNPVIDAREYYKRFS